MALYSAMLSACHDMRALFAHAIAALSICTVGKLRLALPPGQDRRLPTAHTYSRPLSAKTSTCDDCACIAGGRSSVLLQWLP